MASRKGNKCWKLIKNNPIFVWSHFWMGCTWSITTVLSIFTPNSVLDLQKFSIPTLSERHYAYHTITWGINCEKRYLPIQIPQLFIQMKLLMLSYSIYSPQSIYIFQVMKNYLITFSFAILNINTIWIWSDRQIQELLNSVGQQILLFKKWIFVMECHDAKNEFDPNEQNDPRIHLSSATHLQHDKLFVAKQFKNNSKFQKIIKF